MQIAQTLILPGLLCTWLFSCAQIQVSGTVLNADSRQPVAGIPVVIQGARSPLADALPGKTTQNVATVTDANGHFALKLRPKGNGWAYSCHAVPPRGMLPNMPPVSVVEAELLTHDSTYTLTFLLAPATAVRLENPRPGESITVSAVHVPTGHVCVAPTPLTAAWMELDPMPATGLMIRWQRSGQPGREALLKPGQKGLVLE